MNKSIAINLQQVSKSFTLNKAERIKDLFKRPNTRKKIRTPVLKKVDFSVKKNETVGLFGPNGSGKSTLLRIIAGIFEQDSGIVEINGSIAPVLELGAGLHIDLTGLENIELYGSLLGLSDLKSDKKIEKIISFSELKDHIHLPIRKYSSGMKSRLAFSIAIFSNADIFLLDEVFAVGDRQFIDKSHEVLKRLKRKKTIIITSHQANLLYSFCDRIVRFEDGFIRKKTGLTEFFLDLPKNTEFISEICSNSMAPFFRKGDQVVVKKVPFSQIKIGDTVAIYLEKMDEVIVHRIAGKTSKKEFISRGDNNYFYDSWVLNQGNYLGLVRKK